MCNKKLNVQDESICQNEISEILSYEGVPFTREKVIGASERIDFLCYGCIGIEVKLRGSAWNIARQIKRYDKSDIVQELVLVTSRSVDPTPIGLSKPLEIVFLSRAWL